MLAWNDQNDDDHVFFSPHSSNPTLVYTKQFANSFICLKLRNFLLLTSSPDLPCSYRPVGLMPIYQAQNGEFQARLGLVIDDQTMEPEVQN